MTNQNLTINLNLNLKEALKELSPFTPQSEKAAKKSTWSFEFVVPSLEEHDFDLKGPNGEIMATITFNNKSAAKHFAIGVYEIGGL